MLLRVAGYILIWLSAALGMFGGRTAFLPFALIGFVAGVALVVEGCVRHASTRHDAEKKS